MNVVTFSSRTCHLRGLPLMFAANARSQQPEEQNEEEEESQYNATSL
jgi:hypothetical protein